MLRFVQFHRPGSTACPRMTGELAAHHLHPFGPFIEVVRRRMDPNDPPAAFDKIQNRFLLRFIGCQLGRVVQADHIKSLERLRCEDTHVIAMNNLKSPRFFAHDIQSPGPIRNRTVLEPPAQAKHQHCSLFRGLHNRFIRHRIAHQLHFLLTDGKSTSA